MKKKILSILIILFGFFLLLYPWISNFIFEKSTASTIRNYEKNIRSYDQKQKDVAWREAKKYNQQRSESENRITDPFHSKESKKKEKQYYDLLNMDRSGIMGYLKIPCILVDLPIYHGTSDEILEQGAGHLLGSSLPVGGKNTHSILTGHTGRSRAKLFTDLIEMKKGDLFFIHVLDHVLAYKVDEIVVVKPEDTKNLQIIKEKDYITLITCTPYGVNDHRLLVRGERTKYIPKEETMKVRRKNSKWKSVYKTAIIVGSIIVSLLFCLLKMLDKIRGKLKKK